MRRDYRLKKEPLVMIVPMIDIMLFLLVFFMLSTLHMTETSAVRVALPQASTATAETSPNVVTLTVTAEGKVLFGTETLPSANLEMQIQNALQNDGNTIFVLRGDRRADYGQVIAVLDTLKRLGARRISMATETKGGN